MDYDALTIDTQAVEANGFNFDGGLLAQLKQFANGPTKVVIAQIVVSEISRHLRKNTQAAKDAMEKAHKNALRYGLPVSGNVAFAEEPDARSVAVERLKKYIKEIGAEIISHNIVPMQDLVRTYVHVAPPFAGAGKKKNEFPDAIALLSLAHWANANDKRILAVSGDKDWSAFANGSPHIDVVPDLSEALVLLQKDIKQADDIAQQLIKRIATDTDADLARQFKCHLSDAVSGAEVDAEADSCFQYEASDVQVTLCRYEIDEDNIRYPAQVVQVGRAKIVVDVDLRVFVNAEATFSLSVHDPVDDDYVGIGSTTAQMEEEEESIGVLVTIEGDFLLTEIEITNVELIRGLDSMHFGEVEPDYDEPDYDELSEVAQATDNAGDEVDQDKPL